MEQCLLLHLLELLLLLLLLLLHHCWWLPLPALSLRMCLR
jgi:hypothetical protein